MSMLAGPRRKQKVINLRAKNNAWSNDNSKFGQRMLEKMGWSTGKGLGANENGIVEHVVARYKNDEKGLGFEDKNDQWTKHEDDFNALLSNLSNDDTSVEKLHSGISLEVKSKKSKARVHYHKFTRGKDLTRYSEKDLANIFGKKSLKSEETTEILITEEVKDIKESETVFTEKGSMEDYFKSKLAAFKSKSSLIFNNNMNNDGDDNTEYVFQGFSTNSDEADQTNTNSLGYRQFSFYGSKDDGSNTPLETNELSFENGLSSKKKKKKKSKSKQDTVELETNTIADEQDQVEKECETDTKCEYKVKKKKRSKQDLIFEGDDNLNSNNDLGKSKKKKKRNNSRGIAEGVPSEIVEEPVPKKSKKSSDISHEVVHEKNISKKKIKTVLHVVENEQENVPDCYIPKKKKKKKN